MVGEGNTVETGMCAQVFPLETNTHCDSCQECVLLKVLTWSPFRIVLPQKATYSAKVKFFPWRKPGSDGGSTKAWLPCIHWNNPTHLQFQSSPGDLVCMISWGLYCNFFLYTNPLPSLPQGADPVNVHTKLHLWVYFSRNLIQDIIKEKGNITCREIIKKRLDIMFWQNW